MPLQIRRGPTADRTSITPVVGELIFDETEKRLYVGDGTTAGGVSAASFSTEDAQDATAQLFNHADHTGISFTYNDSQGKITAIADVPDLSNYLGVIKADGFKGSFFTDDSTTLIDGVLGSVNLDGTVRGHIVPQGDELYDLGSVSNKFRDLYLSGSSIQLGDATITSTGSAVNLPTGSTINDTEISKLEVLATDDSVIVETSTKSIFATRVVSDNFEGILNGGFIGDMQGSVFADDSSIVVDGITGDVSANIITANNIETTSITTTSAAVETLASTSAELVYSSDTNNSTFGVNSTDNAGILALRKISDSDLSGTTPAYGRVVFARDDANGPAVNALIAGTDVALTFAVDDTGTFADSSKFFVWTGTSFGIGKEDPAEALDVNGNGVFSGFVQFGSLTSTERDDLTAANGMVIYNTTNNKFEGYQNGAWINLDDGTAAS